VYGFIQGRISTQRKFKLLPRGDDGNHPTLKALAKRREEGDASWKKTLYLKSRKLGFSSFFLVLYKLYSSSFSCILFLNFVER